MRTTTSLLAFYFVWRCTVTFWDRASPYIPAWLVLLLSLPCVETIHYRTCYLFLFIFLCICSYTYVHRFMCTCADQRSASSVFLVHSLPNFWSQDLLPSLSIITSADWLASEPQGSCPSPEWITVCLITFSFRWVRDQILVLMLVSFDNRAIFSILKNFFWDNFIAILMMLLILGLITRIPQHPSDYEEVSHYGFDWHVTNTVLSIFSHTIDHLQLIFY